MPDLTITESIVCGVVSALLLGVIAWALLGGFDALDVEERL